MIRAVVLYHPQSAQLLRSAFPPELVQPLRISCGAVRVPGAELSEAADFSPSYASWNSMLFETSVILTVWEHASRLIGDDHVAFLHTDLTLNRPAQQTWSRVAQLLQQAPQRAVGLTAPVGMKPFWRQFLVPEQALLRPAHDPMIQHGFECGAAVWDFIQRYDPNLYDWALHEQPMILYAHQFACSREVLDRLGAYLYNIARNITLQDVGLWTPHVFERLIGLWLVRYGGPAALTTAFWHHQSSGLGQRLLYGPRPLRYAKLVSRRNFAAVPGKPPVLPPGNPGGGLSQQ